MEPQVDRGGHRDGASGAGEGAGSTWRCKGVWEQMSSGFGTQVYGEEQEKEQESEWAREQEQRSKRAQAQGTREHSLGVHGGHVSSVECRKMGLRSESEAQSQQQQSQAQARRG